MIRRASRAELDMILDWAAREGWNPGLEDAAAFHAADPDGFFVAEVDNTPVAAISVVNHAPGFAFLGLYICRPEYRGRGIGYGLWQEALKHAGDRTIGLDGVAEQQANYAKSGFVRAGATRRLCGTFVGPAPVDPDIRRAEQSDLPALIDLDRQAFGVSRPAFLIPWLAGSGTRHSLILSDGTGPTGFATVRRCGNGHKIGPVVAPDATSGLRLARAAQGDAGGEIILDVPDSKADFGQALRQIGFEETFATARMYRGKTPRIGATGHAVATLELG